MSNIWVPKFKIIEPKSEILARSEMEGWYRLKVVGPDGVTVRKDTGWFPNIITDVGLDEVGASPNYLGQCRVGTGNSTPSVLNTALDAQIATTTSLTSSVTTGAQASAPYYGFTTRTFRFAQGAAAGNVAEVGIGVSGGVLFSRALILDGGGLPTTITVLSTEFLDVTYQLRIKPPLSDVVDTINISGTVYDRTTRAYVVTNSGVWSTMGQGGGANLFNFTLYSGALAAITSAPSGSGYFGVAQNTGSYSSGSYQRDFQGSVGLADHTTSIQCISMLLGSFTSGGGMQMQFTPLIPKTGSNILTLNFRHIWARGTP